MKDAKWRINGSRDGGVDVTPDYLVFWHEDGYEENQIKVWLKEAAKQLGINYVCGEEVNFCRYLLENYPESFSSLKGEDWFALISCPEDAPIDEETGIGMAVDFWMS